MMRRWVITRTPDDAAAGGDAAAPAEALSQDALLAVRFVDGDMDAREREVFAARMAAEPALAARVRELRQSDDALREAFAAKHVGAMAIGEVAVRERELHGAGATHVQARHGWWRGVQTKGKAVMAIAASVLVVGAMVWVLTAPMRHPLARLYARERADNFTPETVCTTREEFATWTQEALQQAMVAESAAGVTLVGWDYAPEVQYYTCVLIAQVDGKPVLVTMDRLDREKIAVAPRARLGALHVFERVLGEVRLREITPWEQARVVPGIATLDE
jgi:hypothetical protein